MNRSDEKLYYSSYDIYIPNEYGSSSTYNVARSGEEEDEKDIVDIFFDKLLSVFSPIKKSRKLKKYKRKIKRENVDMEATTRRLEAIEKIPFLYFGEVESHPMYQLYKYIEITNHIRDLNFMEQWLIDSHLRQRCYDDVMAMNDEYLLKGSNTYDDNVRPSYQDKWYNQLKTAIKDYAVPVDFECKFGFIQFPDAIWDVLGCMVFKQFMGNNVNSSLVCHIDHIFPLSRIKGGASEFQNLCVLNKTVNSVSRKGKHHLFELYEDAKVNSILDGCVRRSTLTAFFNSNIRKNVNKQSASFKKALEDATHKFLVSYGVQKEHIETIEATPNPSTDIHVIRVKFNSSGK
ncbi:hypothetical protein H8356DRAFT_1647583 [Neocallimastix lanati (nom. inval.)]|jgi:hypothetical protein|uniref:Uncharacterized protein n=1 Tax=Neocallimastix californiae TaxID=1754190 RepID=A0A1Y2AGC6_9FUNG|nr:hypothetical protein H8356DRAFT_1647583 [Neocallimastix sp. JGI-2020a]ORY21601.1 hypothetical protein LY90DRAFT_139660 [Neocallimastix californiae]|eukprot:ORY21601.1 hypothetical protein LY90DRAFT_139660 [Neocallimastix californiae]